MEEGGEGGGRRKEGAQLSEQETEAQTVCTSCCERTGLGVNHGIQCPARVLLAVFFTEPKQQASLAVCQ